MKHGFEIVLENKKENCFSTVNTDSSFVGEH